MTNKTDDFLEEKWNQVKTDQPDLLDRCYRLCLQAKAKGFTRWSADAMFHVLRFQTGVSTSDGTSLKINNNFSAFVSRDLMEQYPELDGFFQTRLQKPRGNWGQVF